MAPSRRHRLCCNGRVRSPCTTYLSLSLILSPSLSLSRSQAPPQYERVQCDFQDQYVARVARQPCFQRTHTHTHTHTHTSTHTHTHIHTHAHTHTHTHTINTTARAFAPRLSLRARRRLSPSLSSFSPAALQPLRAHSSERFLLPKTRTYEKQYSSLYFTRFMGMRKFVTARAEKKWPGVPLVKNLMDVEPSKRCIILGTVYKEMKLKPNILDEFQAREVWQGAGGGGHQRVARPPCPC